MQAQPIIPTKSPNDKRLYEAYTLSNQLKIIFIHDPEIIKSACSISVGVGNLYDKDRSLGLAHFLQHMLFMGSEKYPEHNEYSSFISSNSGNDNAYTSDIQTNYYFEIKNSVFNEAVERLVEFFTSALLKEECILKQSQAVHEEFVLWSNDDNCRKWEILRKMGSHPYNRFNIGNVDTLRHEFIREDLLEFYQTYYSANIINAVLCSSQSIDDMKKTLLPFFEAIPNKKVQFPECGLHFTKQQTAKFINMQSIKDEEVIEFFFAVQFLKPHYKKHVEHYISHIIGHEGQNSLLSILKQKKFASELSAYAHDVKTQTIVGIQVKLTQEGAQEYELVYNIVMDYLSFLKAQKYVYEQIKQKKLISFQFKQKQKISNYVCRLSSDMHYINLQEILNHSAIFQEFDENLINRVLRQLNPFNAIVVMSGKEELENPTLEKYLGGKYTISDLPKRNKSGIIFNNIPKNQFIPIDTTFSQSQTEPSIFPIKLKDNIQFLHDSSFRVCKGGVELRILSNETEQFKQFYIGYLNLLLKELTYPAETLSCSVQYESDGSVIIKIFGFSDTVIKLIEAISQKIGKVHLEQQSQTLFDVSLNDLIEEYQNTYSQESDDVATTTLDIILNQRFNTVKKTLEELEAFNYEAMTQRIGQFWASSTFKWVVVGNFQQNKVIHFINNFEAKVKEQIKPSQVYSSGCLKLESNISHEVFLQSEELSSSCSIVYYQAGPYSQQLYYKLLLLKNHIDEPFFNQLRTQRQMAYFLRVKIENVRGVLGLYFILVSSTRDPANITQQIKGFVQSFFGKLSSDLEGENADKYETLKQSILTKLKTPHNNLEALFDFIIQEISQKTNYFNRKEEQQIKKRLDPIKVSDLIDTWESMKSVSLDLHVVSQCHSQSYKNENLKSTAVQEIKQKNKFWNDYFC